MSYLELLALALAAPLLLFPGSLGIPAWVGPWLGLALVLLAHLAGWIVSRRRYPVSPLDLPVLTLAGLAVLSYRISIAPELSWNRLWSLVFGLLVYLVFSRLLQSLAARRAALLLLGLLTLAVAAFGLAGTDWSKVRLVDLPWLYDRLPTLLRGLPGSGVDPASELFNPRWVGVALAFLLPVCWGLAFYSRQRPLRLASAALALVGSAVLLLTQAIQGLAGLFAGLLFLVIWRTRPARRWLWAAGGLALLAGLAAFLFARRELVAAWLFSLENPLGAAASLRFDIWSRALAMLRDLPFTGIGLNTFSLIQTGFYPGFLIGPEPHAHNLYLQTALDFGLPGLAAFFWLVAAWFWIVWRKLRSGAAQEERLLLAGLAACLISYLAHGFLDSLMLGAKPGAALWLILAIGAAPPQIDPSPAAAETAAPHPANRLRRLPAGLAVALLLLLAAAPYLIRSNSFSPPALSLNRANLAAIQALARLERGQPLDPARLVQARAALQTVPTRPSSLDFLARLSAWQEDPAAALAASQQRLALDRALPDPFASYYPPESWLRRARQLPLPPAQALADLERLYQAWHTRYPQRAGLALRLALLQVETGQPAQASQTLAQSLAANSQPPGLIPYAIAQLGLP
jgi:putative inorganic carbon (HCO3(-)) transporter